MTEVMEGQVSMFDLDTWFGRTYPEHCPATAEKTSESSLKKQQKSQTKTPLFLDLRGGQEDEPISFYPQMKAESQCVRNDGVANTLVNGTNPGFQNGIVTAVVRRLTPEECERLQGFPTGWTDIGEWVDEKGKTHKESSDSARYKALGNSIALPYWKVLARKIAAQYDRDITMGSLFDGIGGFPLAFQHCGATPVWASEIEDFPIAVTKRHFPEKERQ